MIVPLADRLGGVKAYYFVKKLDEIRSMISEGKDVINFGIGSPDMAPSDDTVSALHQSSLEANKHGYQPYKAIPELRDAISNFYERTYGVPVDPTTQILPLMGSKEGILHLTLAFMNPGDEVLVPNPGYPAYSGLSRLLGGNIKLYDLTEANGWYPDFKEIEKEDLSGVKLMWLNYPHMPTGTPAKRAVFEQCIAFAKKHDILLCHDNPYSLVLNKQQPLSILSVPGASDVAIELNSLSKSHNMAGWRIGMMIGNEEYVNAALRVKSNIDSGMFYGLQAAAAHALTLDEEWHNLRNQEYQDRRNWVFRILDKLGFEYNADQEGMFVWAKPGPEGPKGELTDFIDQTLQEKHIFFTPGMIFGSNGDGFIRISLCVTADRMEQAFNRL